MADVFKVVIRREPDAKAGLLWLGRGIELAPRADAPEPPGKAKEGGEATWLGAAGRLLTPALLAAYREHFLVPLHAREDAQARDTSEQEFEKLHSELHAAFLARDGERIDGIAAAWLERDAALSLAALDPVARAAYAFFDAHRGRAPASTLLDLGRRFSPAELGAHLATAPALMSRLKGRAVAAMAQRTLGAQPFDTLHMMRSLAAFQIVAAAQLLDTRKRRALPDRLIGELIEIQISLAHWIYEIDVCKWEHAPTLRSAKTGEAKGRPPPNQAARGNPLRRQLDAIARFDRSAAGVVEPRPPGGKVAAEAGCDCSGDLVAACSPPDPCCADIDYYVAETLVLKDRVLGYQPSDLAYVENVQAFEKRARKHGFTRTIEDYSETETTLARSDERDHQVSDRFSLQKEMSNQIKQSLDVTAQYGSEASPYSVEIKAGLSKDVARHEAREEIRETVSRAVTKLQSEQRSLTTHRVTTEETEVNRHVFDNQTDQHSVGKYFYVSKIVEGQVFGHGKRVTVELLIPSPAALYEHLEHVKMMRGFTPTPVPAVVTPKDITVEDYEKYLKQYAIGTLPAPPVPPPPFTTAYNFSASPDTKDEWNDPRGQLAPQPGYCIDGFWFTSVECSRKGVNMAYQLEVVLVESDERVFRRWDRDGNIIEQRDAATGLNLTTTQSIQLTAKNSESFECGVKVSWAPLPPDLLPWQTAVCAIVNAADRAQREAAEFAEYKRKYEEGRLQRHPFTDKEILIAEIKRAAIYMMCQNFERGGVMNMKAEPCGYPEINRRAAAEECWDWYFWELAFDWGLMSFKFYDYFWNPMCSWPDKFDPGHPNYMFNSFLRAGVVRVHLPAGPAMDADVVHYLETGEKWGEAGEPPPDATDPRWMSVVAELRRARDCYQNDREGMVTGILDSAGNRTNQVLLTGTDRYWDPIVNAPNGVLDDAAIADDVDRQIFIDGVAYRIQAIVPDPASPPYSDTGPSQMQWIVTLERQFEGAAGVDAGGAVFPQHAHAIGAQFIGAPFRWEEPTQLVWLGDGQNKCLPTYPIKC